MDATRALEEFKTKHRAVLAEIADRGTMLDEADIDDLLSLSLPGMDEVIGEVERDAAELRALLTDATHAAFTWVTLLEPLPIDESEDGVRAIEALGVRVDTIVANRTWPAPDCECRLCTPRFEAESKCRVRLAKTFARKRLLEVPASIVEPRGVGALSALARSVTEMKA